MTTPITGLENIGTSPSASMNSPQHQGMVGQQFDEMEMMRKQTIQQQNAAINDTMRRQMAEIAQSGGLIRQQQEKQQNARIAAERRRQMAEMHNQKIQAQQTPETRREIAEKRIAEIALENPHDPVVVAREKLNNRLAGGPIGGPSKKQKKRNHNQATEQQMAEIINAQMIRQMPKLSPQEMLQQQEIERRQKQQQNDEINAQMRSLMAGISQSDQPTKEGIQQKRLIIEMRRLKAERSRLNAPRQEPTPLTAVAMAGQPTEKMMNNLENLQRKRKRREIQQQSQIQERRAEQNAKVNAQMLSQMPTLSPQEMKYHQKIRQQNEQTYDKVRRQMQEIQKQQESQQKADQSVSEVARSTALPNLGFLDSELPLSNEPKDDFLGFLGNESPVIGRLGGFLEFGEPSSEFDDFICRF